MLGALAAGFAFSLLYLHRQVVIAGPFPPATNTRFYEVAAKSGTDKVFAHSYHDLYSKYLTPMEHEPINLLEIGLGCRMKYGAGASWQLWHEFFTQGQIHFVEKDGECVKEWHRNTGNDISRIIIGDATTDAVVQAVIRAGDAFGGFDVIIDDGSHRTEHQIQSIQDMWPALKPGGIYVIEDLITSYITYGRGGHTTGGGPVGKPGTTIDFIKLALDQLMCAKLQHWKGRMEMMYAQELVQNLSPMCSKWHLPGLMSVDCFLEACVFTKGNGSMFASS